MNAKIVANDAIHADFLVGACVVGQNDANRLLPLLSLQNHRVAAEQLQLVHFRLK